MADGAADLGDRVLVLAPTARDGVATRDLLAGAGIRSHLCATIADVCREAALGAGAALVTAEAVVGDAGGQLAGLLKAQPRWSDLPVVVLTPPGPDPPRLLTALEALGSTTLMKRPVQVSTLVSAVRGALRDRRRQYEVRALLAERERAAEALRAERERYRVTLASIGDAVIATDAGGGVTFLNPVAEALTGWAAADAAGRPLTDVFRIVNEATRREVENPALRALANGVIVGLANHTVLIARDGTERPIDDSAAPIRDGGGAVGGAVLVFRDITERKRAEEGRARLAAESERRKRLYETILSNTPDLAYVWGLDHRFVYANEGLLKMWGKTWDEAIGRNCLELGYEPWHAEMHDREIEQVKATKRPVRGEVPFAGTFGRRIYDYILVPVLGADGEVEAVAGTTRDVTDRKVAEEELRTSGERQAYLVKLADTLRPLSAPADVQAAATRLLGEHLGANRVLFFEIRGPDYVVARDYANGVGSLAGRYPVASFGGGLLEAFLAGRTVVEADATSAPDRHPDARAAFAAVRVRGHVDVPLVRGGVFVAGMTVHFSEARAWTATEVALVEQTAERTWAAVERARAEEALRASEERYRTLFTTMDEGFCVIEVLFDGETPTDYRFLEVNPAFEKQTGLHGAAGRRVRELAPDHERHWFEAYGRVARTGEPVRFVNEATALGRWFDVYAFPLGDKVAVLFNDITARKRADAMRERQTEQLRESEERFRLMADAVPVLIWLSDRSKKCIWFNKSWLDFTGRPMQELLGDGWAADVHPDDLDRCLRTYVTRFDARRPFTMEYRLRRHDGEYRWVEDNGIPRFDGEGAFVGYIGSCVDFTDRKRGEEALQESDRRKDDFIALLAHELRNPLAPIRNGLQVLRLSRDEQTRARSQAMMDRQLAHMVRMIDDLLDVSRIGRNKMELRRARVALADVVGSAVETARPAIEEAGHELTVSLPPHPVFLDADLTRLSQVLSNLLTNSAKYTERGGTVRLSADSDGCRVVVSVRDNGIGIPARALPTIFDMFSQVNRPIERSTGGLGIGLALVKGLVEMHGGTVEARSEGEGRGSTFTVTLPVAVGRAEPAGAAEAGPAAGPGRRVLVVDDSRDGAESMADMLRLLGHDVRTAHDGVEAVEAAGEFRPGVILMDVGMPRLNGLDATRRIRAEAWGERITIVALTGWGQENDRERSREAGCDGHLVKPVGLADLVRVLAEAGG